METSEQEIARLREELAAAAQYLAEAQERVAHHATDREQQRLFTLDVVRRTWRELKAVEHMATAEFELALHRWINAQL